MLGNMSCWNRVKQWLDSFMSLLPALLVTCPVTWVSFLHKPHRVQLRWEDKGSHVPTLPGHGYKAFLWHFTHRGGKDFSPKRELTGLPPSLALGR